MQKIRIHVAYLTVVNLLEKVFLFKTLRISLMLFLSIFLCATPDILAKLIFMFNLVELLTTANRFVMNAQAVVTTAQAVLQTSTTNNEYQLN